jgi:hypothetical protein
VRPTAKRCECLLSEARPTERPDINGAAKAQGVPVSDDSATLPPAEPDVKHPYAQLFGYVVLDARGNVVERCSDPPSLWRPEIRARFRG